MDEPDFDEFFDDMTDEETEFVIQYLVDRGAAEWDGMDQYGERMFSFNMDILAEVMPKLWQQVMEDVDKTLLDLFEAGLANVEYDENLEATISITEKGEEILKNLGMDFPKN
jgi:hypothetical protein